jgi:hypothetical protein
MIETLDLNWRRNDLGWALHFRRAKSPILCVVADATYAGMWRIRLPDGRLTDMSNLARAKDAALSAALETLNPKKEYRESRSDAPPARLVGRRCSPRNGLLNAR